MPALATERRKRIAHASLKVVRRAEGDDPATPPARIVGHAAVFDQQTTLYEGRYYVWREVLRPGCFKRAIAEKQDVRALFNHDSNFVLGRTKSGTCRLSEDETGLAVDDTPPDTQTIRDLVLVPMERGDIDGMSFAFLPIQGETTKTTKNEDGSYVVETAGMRTTVRYEGEKRIEEDEILDADLFDVSVVVYPAYTGTDVGLRHVGPDIESRAREMDRPHKAPAPKRESYRRWLDQAGACPSGSA